jgi:fructokinase
VFVSIGEILIDMLSIQQDVSIDKTDSFIKSAGGAPANVATGLAKLGAKSVFIGCVGDDPFGDFLINTMKSQNVDISYIKTDKSARTTLAFAAKKSDGTKDIVFYRNPGADTKLTPDDIPVDIIKTAVALHYGSISLSEEPMASATLLALKTARSNGVFISCDPNYRPHIWKSKDYARKRIAECIGYADLVKISDEEREFVTGEANIEKGARKLSDRGVKLVIVTLGEKGCYFDNGRVTGYVDGFDVKVKDTLGAGDGFISALLFALQSRGLIERIDDAGIDDLKSALVFANAAGAIATRKNGAIPALPSLSDIQKFLNNRGLQC